jgi:hypothetical protein
MTRTAPNHRPAATRQPLVPPLPHPSWRHGEAAGTRPAAPIDANAFWQRLGL